MRGALDYQPQNNLSANDYATAQATQALAGSSLPVKPAATKRTLPRLTCPSAGGQQSSSAIAAGYLGRTINTNGGSIPGFDSDPDLGSTANAVTSLVAAGYGSRAIDAAVATLKKNAATFTRDGDAVLPASSAALALVAHATKGNPRSFGGTNPIKDIQSSRTLVG